MTKDDQLLVLLIGHGTSLDGDEAKFNLVGPDLSATEWGDLLQPIAGPPGLRQHDRRQLSVPAKAGGQRPRRADRDRRGGAAVRDRLPRVLHQGVRRSDAADLDKNGRVSIWEAFTYASAGVRQWFEQKGQLPTERPLLDDTGAGIGREAQNPGTDGASRASPISSPTRCSRCRPTRRSPG